MLFSGISDPEPFEIAVLRVLNRTPPNTLEKCRYPLLSRAAAPTVFQEDDVFRAILPLSLTESDDEQR